MGSSLNTQKKVASSGARDHRLHCVERNARVSVRAERESGMTRKTSELYIPSPTLSRAFLDLSEVSVISEDGSSPFCDLKDDFYPKVWLPSQFLSVKLSFNRCLDFRRKTFVFF